MSETKKSRSGTPNVYAIIPAVVRYDRDLPPNAKLLYGEITALANFKGYCFASNDYFAQLYGMTKKTVSNLIAQLAAKDLIHVIVERDAESNTVLERKIYIPDIGYNPECAPSPEKKGEGAQIIADPSPEKKGYPSPENSGYPPPKKKDSNNTSINNTPYSPPEGERAQPAHFEAFWAAYPNRKDKQRAQKAFRRLKVTEPMLAMMLTALDAQKRSEDWRKSGGQYVPLPSTWLNNRRWEDEAPQRRQQQAQAYRPQVVEEEDMDVW